MDYCVTYFYSILKVQKEGLTILQEGYYVNHFKLIKY